MPELILRRRRPLQEIDLSHPRLRTGILASRPLASSPPSSTLQAPLLRPSRPPRPATTVYPPRSASRCRQPSLLQHRHILSRCIHGAAPEAVLFHICSTYLSQQENRSPLLYSDFLSWLRSCLCPVCTFRSAMARSTLYSHCLWFPLLYSTLVKSL